MMICCAGIGCMYIIFTYLLQAAWPTAWAEIQDIDGGAVLVIAHVANQGMAYFFTACCVIGHYYVKNPNRTGSDFIRHLIVPLIGAAYTMYMLISLNGTSLIYGIIWLILGIIWLAIVTKGFKKSVTMHLDE